MKVRTDTNTATTPLICIPTTLSAGEYSSFAAATDPRDHTKRIFVHPASITLSVVILDPGLGRMSPPDVWFTSGVRAMDHCIELLCRVTHPDVDVRMLMSPLRRGWYFLLRVRLARAYTGLCTTKKKNLPTQAICYTALCRHKLWFRLDQS
jgi:alcohol dehydrogenase class IV